MPHRRTRRLRIAFAAGAAADLIALIPMLSPSAAGIVWGVEDITGPYSFAMWSGASLMMGWTALLMWAYRHPAERAFVAILTILVILGLVASEMAAAVAGYVSPSRMILTWCLQAVLLAMFAGAYLSRGPRH